MNKIRQIIVGLGLVAGLGLSINGPVGAVNVYQPCNATTATSAVCASQGDSITTIIHNIINTILFILGAVSVIMIIIGGFKYVVSGGDQAGITSAKNTILYAVVGLVVAFASFAIVSLVVTLFSVSPAEQTCVDSGGTYNKTTKTCK